MPTAIGEAFRGIELDDQIEIDPNSITPGHDLLEAVVRSSAQPLYTRIRCAAILHPTEKPKLSAQAMLHFEGDMADRLDRAIARSDRARLVEGSRLIEASADAGSPAPAKVRRV
jgi:hypothetical protein